jgi:PTH1 family peptidyl-tRNA hydrolase
MRNLWLYSCEEKIILAKPLTFMNNSGEAVGLIMHYYKINIKDLIVVHDDKDIQLGEYKFKKIKNLLDTMV